MKPYIEEVTIVDEKNKRIQSEFKFVKYKLKIKETILYDSNFNKISKINRINSSKQLFKHTFLHELKINFMFSQL